ncbi:apolipoprotein N-acyltransferase [Candidatus Pseudomonas adelgestsugas]|uniref:Apolipoprotein N-acyltransferase n=1 Tax=Candidatus Pseudomonas adelgestsugas TaxID=1302376 RepID=A0ABX5R8E1_9PSED|nr:apolipoprotein N-acyltransferase [Candidatus Pseudomonas adelgestsugas]QAX81691.1 Apolipoprotein N-acyltransferase [Candidatus Pseudomonas adelgestsugas]
MQYLITPGWRGNLIAVVVGATTTLALAPFNLWPFALVVVGLFYISLRELSPYQAIGRGWCFGCGLFGAGTSWIYYSIHHFGGASVLLAGFFMLLFTAAIACFFAIPAWLWARWLRCNESPLIDTLTFSALWVSQEAFQGWFLTGFPWLYSGYSQLDGPLTGLAPLGGMWLISFVIALTAVGLCNLLLLLEKKRNRFVGVWLVLLGIPWTISLALKHYTWTSPSGAPLTVAAIQGNIEQSMKWAPEQLNAQLSLYRDMSFSSKPVDLLVWPETAVPIFKESVEDYFSMMDKFAANRHTALITGVPIRQDMLHQKHHFNGVTVVGEGRGTYLKQKLVPFGEYVPLQDILRGLITLFDLPMSDFTSGPSDQLMLEAKGYQIAPSICYEVVYPELAANLSAKSDLLLTISNDTWFGRSIGPLQHLQMAQMRALESGRWMIRSTNNGVTSLINPFGQITVQIPQFKRGILYGEVVPMHKLTPYLQWRSWPLIILCLSLFSSALLISRLSKKTTSPTYTYYKS